MENYRLCRLPLTGELSQYAIRLSDNAFVHRELNSEYVAWLAEGNTPLPADSE